MAVNSDVGKLPPYINFKEKANIKIENDLRKDINVINKKCIIVCNDNIWATEDTMTEWFNSIWKSYL